MTRLNALLRNQAKFLLENKRHAMLHAIVLALLPYTAWLSVAVVALVTLRKGWREGGELLVAAMFAHFALSLVSTTAVVALIESLLTFVPCFIAAYVLRLTTNWRAVAGVFFLQIIVAVLLIQGLMPEFIMAQYLYLQEALREVQADGALLAFINDKTGLNQAILANYLLGLQAISIVFSACFSLMFARSLQSLLFYPGGFRREILTFRGDKISLLLLVIILFAARQQSVFAMSLMPVLMFYFLLAGLSLGFSLLARKKLLGSFCLLVTPLLLMPFVMLPVYVIFGSLDSLFNFRLYLPSEEGKTI